MTRYRHLRKAPRKSPTVPSGLFAPAESFVLYPAGDFYDDILAACQAQRDHDPEVTWIRRWPDGAILKIRNGSSADLRKLVARHGGHL